MIPEDLSRFLLAECVRFLERVEQPTRTDIYALSLFVNSEDTIATELVLSFNTEAQVQRALKGETKGFGLPTSGEEARWNYAFWLHAPNIRFFVPADGFEAHLFGRMLQEKGYSFYAVEEGLSDE